MTDWVGYQVEASRAPQSYWDSLWQEGSLPAAINPRNQSLKNQVNTKFDGLFKEIFSTATKLYSGLNLVELGCARSAWLPYFSKEFGFRVTGVDYSSFGCEQAKAILAAEGVDGEVLFEDILRPHPDQLGRFDFVVSFGLVEHFEKTDECLKACSAFLKPGGTLVTVIPNMRGLVGWLQKRLVRDVYNLHVPLDVTALRHAHEIGGLSILRCEYFCFLNFGVLNLNRIRQTFWGLWLSRALNAISATSWILERLGIRLPENRLTSPYIVCASVKPSPRES